jgi:PKD repeat protein
MSLGQGAGCERVPLTAPTKSIIQLFTTAPSAPLNGSVGLVATVTEEAGTPVQNGTLVSFTTTLGRIDPAEARTENGKATATLIAGNQSGVATVTAFSGGATGPGTGDTPGPAGATVSIPIGAAAVGSVVVRADPASIPPGGTAQIVAQVQDAGGNLMAGVPVTFSTTAGSLQAGVVATDANGEARTSLTTSVEATVTARAGVTSGDTAAPTGTVVVTVAALPSIAITASPDPAIAGQPVTFSISVTLAGGGNPVRSVRIEFGDGDFEDLGAVTGSTSASHVYNNDGSKTVKVTVTDTAGQQTSQSLVIIVQPQGPVAVVLAASPSNPSVNAIVTFTATVTPITVAVVRYEWSFGDGTTRVTTGATTTKAYSSVGTKHAQVTVTASDGSTGVGAADVVVSP